MKAPFNVIQVGFGPMGRIITSLMLRRKNIKLVGIVDTDPQLTNKIISSLLDIDNDLDLIVESDLNTVISREKVDVVIIATSSSVEKIFPTVMIQIDKTCSPTDQQPFRLDQLGFVGDVFKQ